MVAQNALAALLDPRAYVTYHARLIAPFNITVPDGETWYALSLWNVVEGSNVVPEFMRVANVLNPVILSPGTNLRSLAADTGFAYICKPSLVTATDIRYRQNPLGLYLQRCARLRADLPQYRLTVSVPANSNMGDHFSTNFPADFDYGLLLNISAQDVSWCGLEIMADGSMPIDNEVSDDHGIRWASATALPFDRATYNGIRVRAASWSGDPAEIGTPVSLAGSGVLRYVKLPVDW